MYRQISSITKPHRLIKMLTLLLSYFPCFWPQSLEVCMSYEIIRSNHCLLRCHVAFVTKFDFENKIINWSPAVKLLSHEVGCQSTSLMNSQHLTKTLLGHISEHYCDVIMAMVASQITSLTIVYSTVYSDADQRKHQSFASLAFVWGIHRGPVNSPYKWPVTRKMFPFDDVIMFRYDLKW